ncbi:MAG: amidohydrolase family protein [Actinomycetota bacterium]|nr:amidohydrolase family protein [Actinomycetota bacterium]
MRTIISAARVLTGPAGHRVDDGAVLVDGGSIAAVGPVAAIRAAAPEARELAHPTGTIIPGLINAHVHLAFDPGPDRLARLTDDRRPEQIALTMAGHAHELLSSGVTTVRDLGDRHGLAIPLRDAIAAGEIAGPRVLAATAPLTPPKGHCWFLGGEVDGAEQIRAAVGRNADAGADVIKVMVSGGSLTPGGAGMWEPQFDASTLTLIVGEARRYGLPVAAHAHGTGSIRACVDAGVDTIEHCTWLTGPGVFEPDEQTARDIVTAGIAVCTANCNDWRPMAAKFGDDGAARIVGRVRWLADRGVRLIAGTDAGMAPFDNFGAALVGFAQYGFTAEQIIELATVTTADAIGLGSVTGRIEAGYDADIVVLAGDPLDDLTALERPELVLARGRPHRPAP